MLYTKEQNLAAFKKLPTTVREFFMSEETSNDISEVARVNSLSPEQSSKLLDITNAFILGFTNEEECEKDLIQSLSLMGERAENLKTYLRNKVVEKVKFLRTIPDTEVSEEGKDGVEEGATENKETEQKNPEISVEKSVVTNTVSGVSKKYQLTVEQEAGIEKEIGKVLSGETKLEAFRSNIVNLYRVTYDQALKIAYEINDQIFSRTKKEETSNKPDQKPVEKPIEKTVLQKQTSQPSQPSSNGTRTQITPNRMIPDHQAIEITDGPHLHSQNIMPQNDQGRGGFGTIIDQKLSRIVRNKAESEDISKRRSEKYRGSDPYREPIQ
jgi:hypothetical protein